MIMTALRVAQTKIIEAHRRTQVSWQVPTALAAGVDLVHTLELNDQGVRARGKCVRRLDELSIETGAALSTFAVAILQRAPGEPDELFVPERKGELDPEASGVMSSSYTLATQLGGRFTSPEYDDELDGFAGNYTARQSESLEVFPRRFAVTGPDIPDSLTDERVLETDGAPIRIAFTGDLLEI